MLHFKNPFLSPPNGCLGVSLVAVLCWVLPIPAAGPVAEGVEEIVFAVREPKGPHWYENFGYEVQD